MKLLYKNQLFECDVIGDSLLLNGRKIPFSAEEYSDNIFKIKVGEEEKQVYTVADDKHFYVFIDGEQYIFSMVTEEVTEISTLENGDEAYEEIKPPMPGSVVKILVEEGQEVSEGFPIIIVEAMKMEITLYSSISGKVKKVNVKVGEQVDSDKVLVEIQNDNL